MAKSRGWSSWRTSHLGTRSRSTPIREAKPDENHRQGDLRWPRCRYYSVHSCPICSRGRQLLPSTLGQVSSNVLEAQLSQYYPPFTSPISPKPGIDSPFPLPFGAPAALSAGLRRLPSPRRAQVMSLPQISLIYPTLKLLPPLHHRYFAFVTGRLSTLTLIIRSPSESNNLSFLASTVINQNAPHSLLFLDEAIFTTTFIAVQKSKLVYSIATVFQTPRFPQNTRPCHHPNGLLLKIVCVAACTLPRASLAPQDYNDGE